MKSQNCPSSRKQYSPEAMYCFWFYIVTISLFLLPFVSFAQMTPTVIWSVPRATNVGGLGNYIDSLGDLNGDGFDDLVVGAFTSQNCGGAVFVISGSDGSLMYALPNPSKADFYFGEAVAGLNDLNGDKKNDFAASVTGTSNNNYKGKVILFSGADGKILGSVDGLAANDRLGYTVENVGDINKDGFDDVAAYAPQTPGGPGYVIVFSGRDCKVIYTLRTTIKNALYFGWGLAGVGDIDQDTYPDFAVSLSQIPNQLAEVYIYSGKTGQAIRTWRSQAIYEYYGASISRAGDVNGDGVPDVLIGAFRSGSFTGRAEVRSGKDGKILFNFSGPHTGSFFGIDVDGGSDLNGDQVPDFVIGAPDVHKLAGPHAGNGRVNAYSGKDGKLFFSLIGPDSEGGFGHGVKIINRLDGDAIPDIAVGATFVSKLHAFSVVPPATMGLSAQPKVGTTINVQLKSPADLNLLYVAGLSLGSAPGIPLPDKRVIPLNPDWLLTYSVTQNNPTFKFPMGVLDGSGVANIPFVIPKDPYLKGQTIYASFLVFDPKSPNSVRRISKALPIKFE